MQKQGYVKAHFIFGVPGEWSWPAPLQLLCFVIYLKITTRSISAIDSFFDIVYCQFRLHFSAILFYAAFNVVEELKLIFLHECLFLCISHHFYFIFGFWFLCNIQYFVFRVNECGTKLLYCRLQKRN